MEQKKFIDIQRLKDKYAEGFSIGEHIVCQEKIDGASAAFAYDAATDKIVAFSRRRQLDQSNTLNGFYDFVMTRDKELFKSVLGDRFICFGEWASRHTIRYPDEVYSNFYMFDVWDRENKQYMPWSFVKEMAAKLSLKTVPVFYDGEFTSWEDIYKLVGRTEMGAEPCGEGIVVKSQDRLANMDDRQPAYVKIVAKEFSEVHQSKPHKEVDPAKIAAKQAAEELAKTIITERRITKWIEKFIEDALIPADWNEHDLGTLAKLMPKAIYEDCVKEEPEIVAQIENFGKICGSITTKLVREFVK